MLTGAMLQNSKRCGDVHKLRRSHLNSSLGKLCWPDTVRLTAISSVLYDDCQVLASLADALADFTDW